MAIDPIVSSALSVPSATPGAPAGSGSRFTQALNRLLESNEHATVDANEKVGAMLEGTGDVHEAMIALQRAEMTLQLTVQVRNKLMQAYQEVMRMPV
jgi:flagellar hook-basal body complex protein FliE